MPTNNSSNTPTGISGTILQGQGIGVASNFSTATYPSSATNTGTILRADGTNWSPTTATYPNTAGHAGNVLTSNGTNWGSTPFGWVLIQSQTASASTNLSFTSGITSAYNNYVLVCSNMSVATFGVSIVIQISTNGGSSYISTNYQSGTNYQVYNSSTRSNIQGSSSFLIESVLANSTTFAQQMVYLRNMTSGSNYVEHNNVGCKFDSSGNATMSLTSGAYTVASTIVNAFQINTLSINTFSGNFTLYGINES